MFDSSSSVLLHIFADDGWWFTLVEKTLVAVNMPVGTCRPVNGDRMVTIWAVFHLL